MFYQLKKKFERNNFIICVTLLLHTFLTSFTCFHSKYQAPSPKAQPGPVQTSKMESVATILNGKLSILDMGVVAALSAVLTH